MEVQNRNIKLEGHSTRVIKIKDTKPFLNRVYMFGLVLKCLSCLVYNHLHGSNFYKIVFLGSFKFYKIVLKFKIIFKRPKLKDWSCFESKCVLKLIKYQFSKDGFKRLEKFDRIRTNDWPNLTDSLSNTQLYPDERTWQSQMQ